MRKLYVISALLITVSMIVSFTTQELSNGLRKVYSRPPSEWPRPFVDNGVQWQELGILPASPIQPQLDSLKHLVKLGSILFFDPRVSGSGKISCASCHQPELSWTDGKPRSVGHEGALNKRNSPSIQNVWFYKKLFWDGRSRDLEDQAFAPINSESEMHGDMRSLARKLANIRGYAQLIDSAYGDARIDPDRVAGALAVFQRTIISNRSRFDSFLSGNRKALSDNEIRGLHLFRTKARCINCHHGPLFTDNLFHNNGQAGNDPGRFNVTHKDDDLGRFKTPSLRDVMKTGPWMHHGEIDNMMRIIELYDHPTARGLDPIIRPLHLTRQEKLDLLAFLEAISMGPVPFTKPNLPQ
jgi:cytochrome c peroxidase